MSKTLFDNSNVTANSKQIALLKRHFPQCFDKHGAFIPEKLQDMVTEGGSELSKESYALNWLGKSYARLLANENPRTLLSEDVEHNAKPANKGSENLLIKGDNLEVLKHLVHAYSEQVKMIYIDPPYNTGSDGFVYQDDRKFDEYQLSQLAGIDRDEAKRILAFTQSKANSHSAWLTFMYPRLYVARELLKDDGVIFISIDDNEVSQLKMLCDEVFGESNFLGCAVRVSKKANNQGDYWSPNFDYILTYAKNIDVCPRFFGGVNYKAYDKVEAEGVRQGDKYQLVRLYMTSLDPLRGCNNQRYYIEAPDGTLLIPPGNIFPESLEDGASIPPESGDDKVWRWSKDSYLRKNNEIVVKRVKSSNLVDCKGKPVKWNVFTKTYLKDVIAKSSAKPNSLIEEHINQKSSHELNELGVPFSYAKPSSLIKYLCEISQVKSRDVVVDFFAGSGTSAQSILNFNKESTFSVKYILVQIPEPLDDTPKKRKDNKDIIAFCDSIKRPKTIFEITKARIEKAAAKIREENPDYEGDLGFKIFETKPLSDAYLDDMLTLSSEQPSLPLMTNDVDDMLTTWQVYDGIALTQNLEELDLAGYTAYQHGKVCYLMHSRFSSKALVAFLQKLDDTENTFEVEKLVVNGVVFDSKYQREITEAITQYKNKKDKHISVEFRY